jgi:hypothetical protein
MRRVEAENGFQACGLEASKFLRWQAAQLKAWNNYRYLAWILRIIYLGELFEMSNFL